MDKYVIHNGHVEYIKRVTSWDGAEGVGEFEWTDKLDEAKRFEIVECWAFADTGSGRLFSKV